MICGSCEKEIESGVWYKGVAMELGELVETVICKECYEEALKENGIN